MDGITIIHDTTNNRRYAQIDLDILVDNQDEIEDLLDGIIVEYRKLEESVPLEEVLNELLLKGNLNKYV